MMSTQAGNLSSTLMKAGIIMGMIHRDKLFFYATHTLILSLSSYSRYSINSLQISNKK